MIPTPKQLIKIIIICLIFILLFFAITAAKTHAYFTTGQDAQLLKDTTALFLIDYSFGTKNHTINIPVQAKNTTETATDTVSYSIIDNEGNSVEGTVTGIVLSNASIGDTGMYKISKGLGRKFTLAVLFTPKDVVDRKQYRLQVNNLPFDFDGTQQLQLNPSELKYYTTELLAI